MRRRPEMVHTLLLGVTLLRPFSRVKEQWKLRLFERGTPHQEHLEFRVAT